MGLQPEIERFFRESQTWDLEMLARSALPSYHSNYPTSPLPPGASGYQNSTARVVAVGGAQNDYALTLDKDYYQSERLILCLVDNTRVKNIGDRRIQKLKALHGSSWHDKGDEVSLHVDASELPEALEHLKVEGITVPIVVKRHDFSFAAGATARTAVQATKVVISFDSCDYLLEARKADKATLVSAGELKIPNPGYADHWPASIVLKRQATDGINSLNTYIRADLLP